MKLLIYTAVFGKPDLLLDPVLPLPEIDKVCFTDMEFQGKSQFDIVQLPLDPTTPAKNQRHVKIHWAAIFQQYDYSLYLDSNVQLKIDPTIFIDMLEDNDLLLFRHAFRSCIYDEAAVCINYRLGNSTEIARQVIKYVSSGYPKNSGLYRCTVLFRKHTKEMQEFSKLWWGEVNTFSHRDQISFPYVRNKLGIGVSVFDKLWVGNPWFKGYEHSEVDSKFARRGDSI